MYFEMFNRFHISNLNYFKSNDGSRFWKVQTHENIQMIDKRSAIWGTVMLHHIHFLGRRRITVFESEIKMWKQKILTKHLKEAQ